VSYQSLLILMSKGDMVNGERLTPEVEREREKVTTWLSLPRSTTRGYNARGRPQSATRLSGLRSSAAEGNASCFHQRKDFVPRNDFHFLDRARCNDRRDFADARLDDYFT
jgi:hypothetical protein